MRYKADKTVVEIYDSYPEERAPGFQLAIVMEFCRRGSLD
jgi:hypothetical protein